MIQLTDNARNEVLELMKGSGFSKPALRVSFEGFGWGGPRMGLVLDELDDKEQFAVKERDVDIVYDGRLKDYIDTKKILTIDFRNDKYGSGFVILGAGTC